MSFVQVVRRTALAGVFLVGNGVIPVNVEAIRSFYLTLYPSDPEKSQALELCFLEDSNFNRLDPKQRETCYQHALATTQEQNGAASDRIKANPVDLRRAAAAGSMPRNDIRRLQQSETVRLSRP